MVNKMLAFFFMFYFIVCSFANPGEKLAKCRLQMAKADLSHYEKDSDKYIVNTNWTETVSKILVPICDNVDAFKEKHRHHIHVTKKYIFDELLTTCGFLDKYLTKNTIDKHDTKHVLDTLLPTCTALYNYDKKIVENIQEQIEGKQDDATDVTHATHATHATHGAKKFKFTLDYFLSSTCNFLLNYQDGDEKDYEGSKFTADDFFPLCDFVDVYKLNTADPSKPDLYCIGYSNKT